MCTRVPGLWDAVSPFWGDQGKSPSPPTSPPRRKSPGSCGSFCPSSLAAIWSSRVICLYNPSPYLSDSKRRKGWFGFPLALEKHWKVFFCWQCPPSYFPTKKPPALTSVVIAVARVLSCLLRQKGALVGVGSVGSRGRKANQKRTISSQPGNESQGPSHPQ